MKAKLTKCFWLAVTLAVAYGALVLSASKALACDSGNC
jgi:hypothetical protein